MMKNILFAGILLIGAALFNSCHKAKKNIDDYFPKTHIVSAVVQSDGSVLVTGEVDSQGEASIEYAGFSCSTSPTPNLLNRQAIADVSGQSFKAVYSDFSPDSTYYFVCWAANKFGYKQGTVVTLSHIVHPPVTPTCSLTVNTVNYGSGNGTFNYSVITSPTNSVGQEWTFNAYPSSGGYDVYFKFGSPLAAGIYTTTTDMDPQPGYVSVTINTGTYYALENGTPVYINTIAADTMDITICSAPWTVSGSTFYMNTRLKVPS